MKVYLDTCCLNRPFDDQTQQRIRLESEAIMLVLAHMQSGEWEWIASGVLNYEVSQIADHERRYRIMALADHVDRVIPVDATVVERTAELEGLGFRTYDAMHIACAEMGNVDIFLTTDDKLLRLATRLASRVHVTVRNPLLWLSEGNSDN